MDYPPNVGHGLLLNQHCQSMNTVICRCRPTSNIIAAPTVGSLTVANFWTQVSKGVLVVTLLKEKDSGVHLRQQALLYITNAQLLL